MVFRNIYVNNYLQQCKYYDIFNCKKEKYMCHKLNLELPKISFDSNLVELITKLEVLRHQIAPLEIDIRLFAQVKQIFYMIESLQSARIEGNRTTISDYVASKFENKEDVDNIKEINNIEKAINYVNQCFLEDENFKISNKFIKELHYIITNDLKAEDSKESGRYRSCNVVINKAEHIPPNPTAVPGFMEELVDWINKTDKIQKQLLKIAIAHHAFTWIHPFDNGNGRMSRILTYAILRQYGFDMAYLLNSTAVFCVNREKYFRMLKLADKNTNEGKLAWCEYVLNGLYNEISKLSKLMNKQFFVGKIVKPAINRAYELHFINDEYKKILELTLNKEDGTIKSKDIRTVIKDKTPRQISHTIGKMLDAELLQRSYSNNRIYILNLMCKDLATGIIDSLYREQLINVEN